VARLAYRDPEHLPERLALYAADMLAEPSRTWAAKAHRARPDAGPAVLADELRTRSARIARIDGAIAGTPFFLAVIPGYLNYLWQEERMSLRTAALYGRDPASRRTIAEELTLRGVHESVEAAEATLKAVHRAPAQKPGSRRPLHTWVRSVKRLLIVGGFVAPIAPGRPAGARGRILGTWRTAMWTAALIFTWIVPLVGVVAMAWACESHTRELGHRRRLYYNGDAGTARTAITLAAGHRERRRDERRLVSALLPLLFAIPVAALALLAQGSSSPMGLSAPGLALALSLVVAAAVTGMRR
jgi:hypothetical protein